MEAKNMTIGQRIRFLRKENGLYQEELAKKIGVSRQAIASWELDRTLPSMKNAYAMAEVFKCDIGEISGADIKVRMEANNEEEFLLLENYRKADRETQKMVLRILKYSKYGD